MVGEGRGALVAFIWMEPTQPGLTDHQTPSLYPKKTITAAAAVLGGMLRDDDHGVQFAETARGALALVGGHPEAFDGAFCHG